MGKRTNFLFSDMASQTDGPRPFDGMAIGSFTDMWGRTVEFKREEMPEYLRNTQLALESTRDSNGEIVGLPIDGMNHNNREAAGWIVGVAMTETADRLLFTPRWTQMGVDLISGDLMRFFSPAIDVEHKVVAGGSLTNWPATRTKAGQILLRPVELSEGLFEVESAPISAVLEEIRSLFRNAFSREAAPSSKGEGAAPGVSEKPGVIEMEMTQEELTAAIRAVVTESLAALPSKSAPAKAETTDLSAFLDMEGLTDTAKAQRKAELKGQLEAIRKQAEMEYRSELVRLEFENRMSELSQDLVSGSDRAPRGLRVSADELKEHLLKLNADEAKWWGEMLTDTVEKGFVEFSEMGHGRTLQGTRLLPGVIADQLKKWLASGQSLADFFTVNAVELGAMADYNLAEYQPKEK